MHTSLQLDKQQYCHTSSSKLVWKADLAETDANFVKKRLAGTKRNRFFSATVVNPWNEPG